jgi:stress-induced morphogen
MKTFTSNNFNFIKNYFSSVKFKFLPQLTFTKQNFVEKNVIEDKLKKHLKIENLEVVDISGNCGTSFRVTIKSLDLKGKTPINQHRTINEILKDELKEMHALQLKIEP